MAFDWYSRNLYWSNLEENTIEVVKTDGDVYYRKVLLGNSGNDETGVARAVSMCLDPQNG